jgi:putative membrane protein
MKSETFKLSKLRNIALAGILAAGVVGPTYVASTAHAEDATNQAAEQQSDQSQEGTDDSNSFVKDLLGSNDTTDADANDPTKTETVYVFNNADGSARNAIVTDWLKNVKGDQSLADVSNLTDIENTESQAGYQQDGQKLTWDAQGDDIYYKGNTTEQAPVTIKVTYWLDGQEIAPDDLAGKSGHVKIRYDYTNNASYQTEVNGEQRTMYTPFVAATGLILDNSNFKNVTTVNGKIANDGDRTTVAGFAMPGLQEDLDISSDDVDIPTYFEIEADATDFSLDTSLTAVSSNLFDSINTDDMSEDTLGDDINKMNDAMNQLIDGSSSLYDGLTQLADGAGQLDDGIGTLQDSTASLPASADALNSGAHQVASGADQVASGSATLADGTNKLASGAAQLPAGVAKLYDGSSQVNKGLEALKNGDSHQWGLVKAMESAKQISDGADQLDAGAQKLAAGTGQLKSQTTNLPSQVNKLYDGSNAVYTGLEALKNGDSQRWGLAKAAESSEAAYVGSQQIAAGVNTLATQMGTIKSGTDSIAGGAKEASAGTQTAINTIADKMIPALTDAQNKLNGGADVDGAVASLKDASNTLTSLSTTTGDIATQLKTMSDGLTKVSSTLGTIQTEAAAASKGSSSAASNIKSSNYDNIATVKKQLAAIDTTGMTDDQKTALNKASSELDAVNTDDLAQAQKDASSAAATDQKIAAEIGAVKDQIDTLQTGIGTQAQNFQKASDSLKSDAATLQKTASSLEKNSFINAEQEVAGVNVGLQKLVGTDQDTKANATLYGLKAGLGEINTGAQTISDNITGSSKYMANLVTGAATLRDGLKTLSEGGVVEGKTSAGLSGAVAALGDTQTTDTLLWGSNAINQGLLQMNAQTPALAGGIAQIDAGAQQLAAGTAQLAPGTKALYQGAGDTPIDGKTSAGLVGAVDALGTASTPNTLLYGSNAIWKGLAQMNASAPALANGVNQVNSGAHQLASGSAQLASGSNQLANGTDQLANATPALVNGIAALKAGSSQLASGAVAAQDGSAQLSDGLKQFNDEAIQKIVSAYNDDLAGLSDNLKATAQAGKDYQTFSGKDDAMQGKVTFIYETDGIGD